MKQWLYVYMQWLLRELRMRYRASAVGGGWLILQPVVHILLFTLVFYQFFQVRWPVGDGSATEYGLQVFIGLSLYTFVADVINRAPASVWSYPYLVTKVRFPVEMLPVVQVGAAGLQLLLALLVTLPFMLWRGLGLAARGLVGVFARHWASGALVQQLAVVSDPHILPGLDGAGVLALDG